MLNSIPRLMCDGDPNAPICIVGMAPGKEELLEGRPFVGPSGDLLWSMTTRAGFTRADAFILNTIAEWPAGKDGAPTDEQLDKYWAFFDAAISSFKGKCIFVLGADAMRRVVGKDGVLSWRGYLMPPSTWDLVRRVAFTTSYYRTTTKTHKKGDAKVSKVKSIVACPIPANVEYVVPTLHPSSIMRTGFKSVPVLAYDTERAWRAATGKLHTLDFSYEPYPTNLTADKESITVDIETSWSPGGTNNFINRVGMANNAGAWSAAWSVGCRDRCRAELGEVFNRTIVGHNLCFDIPELEEAGVKCVGPLFDTMLAAQILQPDILKGLNGVASLYLDVERWKHLSEKQPEKYNAHDAISTHYLYGVLKQALKDQGVYDHFTNHIMPALRVLMDMEREGLKVDEHGRKQWIAALTEEQADLASKFTNLYPNFSISSPAQVAKLLYDNLRVPPPASRSVDEVTLKRLRKRFPEIPAFDLVLRHRELSEYLKRFTKLVPDIKGIVHPSYAPGTKDDEFIDYNGERIQFAKGIAGTGRIQAKEPNPQQLPKKARKVFIPHDTNSLFLEADYDSAELRVCAALSGDKALAINLDGSDLHQTHADDWGCSRDEAKTLIYATIYGASPNKLHIVFTAAGIQTTTERCRTLQERLFARYPDFGAWRNNLIKSLPIERRLVNPFGRPRYFWYPSKDTPAALDFLPQSTVADIVWTRLPVVQAIARKYNGGLRTIVHDSFLFELPADTHREASLEIREALECEFNNIAPGFRLPVKMKAGPNWGELSKL